MRVRLAHRVLTNPMRARGVRKGISRSYQDDDDDDDNVDATAPAAPASAPAPAAPAPAPPAPATAALLLQLLLLQPLLKHRSESQISFVLHRVQCARAAAGLHGHAHPTCV